MGFDFEVQPVFLPIYVALPKKISDTKACINIKNTDQKCFEWCLKYHLGDKKANSERVTVLSKIENTFNMEGINFPTPMSDINTFEKNNQNINVSVFTCGDNGEDLVLSRASKNKNTGNWLYLILFNGHYVYVKNLSRLVGAKKDNEKVEPCPWCARGISEKKYDAHVKLCEDQHQHKDFNGGVIEMCNLGETMHFKNYANQIKQPYVIYFDFESFNKKLDVTGIEDKTKKVGEQVPNSYCYKIVCCYDENKNSELKIYRGENCVKHLLDSLLYDVEELLKTINKYKTVPKLTAEERQQYENICTCSICNEKLEKED